MEGLLGAVYVVFGGPESELEQPRWASWVLFESICGEVWLLLSCVLWISGLYFETYAVFFHFLGSSILLGVMEPTDLVKNSWFGRTKLPLMFIVWSPLKTVTYLVPFPP